MKIRVKLRETYGTPMAIYTTKSGRRTDIYPMLSGRMQRKINKSYEIYLDIIVSKKLYQGIEVR
jgi:hypothetical protein